MDEITYDGAIYAHPFSLVQVEHVPIGTSFLAGMARTLAEHDATLIETADYSVADPPYKEFTILFPAGTRQFFGLRMMRSRYFLIQFPDGFQLHGGELWPLQRGEDDVATIVLHRPGEERQGKEEDIDGRS